MVAHRLGNRGPHVWAFSLLAIAAAVAVQYLGAQAPPDANEELKMSFEDVARPFLKENCYVCHEGESGVAGVRVDLLDGGMEDRSLATWEAMLSRISKSTMPPAAAPQPTETDRAKMVAWIEHALEVARLRPAPKNGMIRRLTVAQYRNTLRQLLLLEDEVTDALPPDAVSREGFHNNQQGLELSPLLTEAYFEIAERALDRVIVDPRQKPSIQNFRVDLGAGINKSPIQDRLILGAGSWLLEPENFTVTQLTAQKPFAFDPYFMQTKFHFIEGYVGNATVRGWRDFESIYHAVFADFRGSAGYPKGLPYDSAPEGLLLRPAIPSETRNGAEGFGPKANFKIAVRELPDDGRFRVTVTAAKYDDGLLLDQGVAAQPATALGAVLVDENNRVTIEKPGVYQVDVHPAEQALPPPDSSRLEEALVGRWNLDGDNPGWKLVGEAIYADTPFGKGVSFRSEVDAVVIPYSEAVNVGSGEFTAAGWINAGGGRIAGIIGSGELGTPGWRLETTNPGGLEFESTGPDGKSNGRIRSHDGALERRGWKHVAVTVGRGPEQTKIYVDGELVGRGTTGPADFSFKGDLMIGITPGMESYLGTLDEFRLYKRALSPREIRALADPGVELPEPPARFGGRAVSGPRRPDVVLNVGDRQFTGVLEQPAFLALRLAAGSYPVTAVIDTLVGADRIVLTPLAETDESYKRFAAFERRSPKVGVHLGFRRDCGSSLIPVGAPQTVAGAKLERYVFEGALRNYPNPEVEANNVNYLAGVREIGVRSEYTDERDMPRLLIRSVEFEGPLYDQWPPAAHENIFGRVETSAGEATQARQIIRRFATKAFRRPLSADEEDWLFSVYEDAAGSGRGFRDSVKDALLVTLTAPQFLFLVEASATPGPEPLDDYELASKLSYFLWNSPPDERTRELAAAGTLRQQLDAEVTRMIRDPKFSRFLNEFVPQWLSLDKFLVLEPDRSRFPNLTRAAKASLVQEPVEYLRYLIANNLPVRDLVQSNFVVANEAVAGYYGLGDKTESGFDFVPIDTGREELGGLLTQAAIMAGLSDGRESNPVKRGAWLARKIIAEPPADPPPNVPALKEDTGDLTLRQRLEQHRDVPACRACHSKIDPWGVALEQVDADGRWKQQPADARSTLPDGAEVDGTSDFKRYLAQDRIDQVAFSVLKHLTIYAAGRSLSYAELDYLKRDGLRLKEAGYPMQDMLRYVANSPMFLEK